MLVITVLVDVAVSVTSGVSEVKWLDVVVVELFSGAIVEPVGETVVKLLGGGVYPPTGDCIFLAYIM